MIWVTTKSSWCEENFYRVSGKEICIILLSPTQSPLGSEGDPVTAGGVIRWRNGSLESTRKNENSLGEYGLGNFKHFFVYLDLSILLKVECH